jgi:hypothetical protein
VVTGAAVPVDLHQRLSEFSYGYGVTREVESLLNSVGLRTTPFLPSLLQEASLAFDVAFDRPGAPLLLQFKLGEALKRFRRDDPSKPAPILGKPFWRFGVETAEPNGQFDVLLKSERARAEVYYVAPRFTTWDHYAQIFEERRILEESLLVTPAEIDAGIAARNEPDGWHRIVYDRSNVYVLSEAAPLKEIKAYVLADNVRSHIAERGQRIDVGITLVSQALEGRRELKVRGEPKPEARDVFEATEMPEFGSAPRDLTASRARRLQEFRQRSRTEADAEFASLGFEAWALGAQLIAATIA